MKPFKVKTYSKFFAASFHEKMLSGSSFTPDVTGTFFGNGTDSKPWDRDFS